MMHTVYVHDIEAKHWPLRYFTPAEVACRHCGELYLDWQAYAQLDLLREILDEPIILNSAHRCPVHNARIGGAPFSEHKKNAWDIRARSRRYRQDLLAACVKAGFSTFGYYRTFLHTDPRPGRRWATDSGRKAWNGLML